MQFPSKIITGHYMAKLIVLFLFTLISSPPSSAATPPHSPSIACKTTLYPKLCLSILSAFQNSPSSPSNYGKFSIKQCLKHARNLSDSIAHFVSNSKKLEKSLMTTKEICALNDCLQLTELIVDYLETTSRDLTEYSSWNVTDVVVGSVESLLSAVVTNQQTCYDGLAEAGSGIAAALAESLGDAARLYSVSLGLVAEALRKGRKRSGDGRRLVELDWARHSSSSPLSKVVFASNESLVVRRRLEEVVDVGVHVSATVIVKPYGGGNFTSINDAIAFAPNNSMIGDGYFVIYAKQGYYEEYVVVPRNKKYIMLIGDGINRTIISGNRSVIDGWTTFNSATFVVYGEGFVAMDIKFENRAGPEKHQAVAVRNNADLSTFYRCSFEGYQDTLYVHSLRQFYRECNIYGTVDFIFGNAAAVFQNCNLLARKPMPNQKIAFTAQGRTDPNQNTGISIHNCTIGHAPDYEIDTNSNFSTIYLGRPWKEYSRTVYMESYLGSLINQAGWLEWNETSRLDTLYYGEYGNYGPGANTSLRVQWQGYSVMNDSQAMNFTVYNFTMGDTWLPYTSIPFSAGLLKSTTS